MIPSPGPPASTNTAVQSSSPTNSDIGTRRAKGGRDIRPSLHNTTLVHQHSNIFRRLGQRFSVLPCVVPSPSVAAAARGSFRDNSRGDCICREPPGTDRTKPLDASLQNPRRGGSPGDLSSVLRGVWASNPRPSAISVFRVDLIPKQRVEKSAVLSWEPHVHREDGRSCGRHGGLQRIEWRHACTAGVVALHESGESVQPCVHGM